MLFIAVDLLLPPPPPIPAPPPHLLRYLQLLLFPIFLLLPILFLRLNNSANCKCRKERE